MNTLKFEVYKNTLKRRDGFNPVLGEKNYTKIKCYFAESDWDKCTAVTANFMSDKDNIVKSTVSLTTDDKTAVFDIPSGLEGDKICFSLTGSYADDSGNTVTLNTNLVGINRQKGMLPSETVDFGLYEKMLSLYNKMNGLYNQLKNEKISKSEGSVVTAYLANGAVTTTKLADNSVNDEKLSESVKSVLNSVSNKANLNDICDIVPSKNLIVLTDGNYTNKNINNATVTVKDNKISIKSNGAVGVSGSISIPAKINLKEETECCLSTQDTVNNESLTDTNPLISLCVNAVKLVDITMSRNGNVMSKVLNVSSGTNCEIRITLAKDKTYDIESNIQLEKGTTLTNFESPSNVKKILLLSLAENSVNKSNLASELQNEIVTYNTLYVTTDLSKVDNNKTFASIWAANNSVKDNNEKNRYIIKVADGEYHDLETTYAGSTDTTQLQGVVAKDYVYYESESNEPAKCVLVWNGAVGFNDLSLLTDNVALKKSIFHITGGDYTERGLHTHIKGFTLRSLNTRYGLHCESGGYGRNVDWFADNCIIEFGGRPQVGDGTSKMPIIGMGVSPHQKGLFKRCSFKYINGASGNTINCHDNAETTTYKTTKAVINGAEIVFDGCNFNGGLLNFVSTNTSDTPYVAQIKNSKVDDGNITYTDNWIIKNKSTTLAGYGITDAYTKEEVQKRLGGKLDSKPFDNEPKQGSPCYLTSGTVYNALLAKADENSVYSKTETDDLLREKADKAEVDTALTSKADLVNSPNIFDFDDWANNLQKINTPIVRGTLDELNFDEKSITFTVTRKDTYTNSWQISATTAGITKISVKPNTKYWVYYSANNYECSTMIFLNGIATNMINVKKVRNGKGTFVTNDDTSFITIRVGTYAESGTFKVSEIMITEKESIYLPNEVAEGVSEVADEVFAFEKTTQTSLDKKYDLSNIESGTSKLTPHSNVADKIKSASCTYKTIGDIVIVSSTVKMNAVSMGANSSYALIDLPYKCIAEDNVFCVGISNLGKVFKFAVLKNNTWLQFQTQDKTAYTFADGEQINVICSYKIK